MIIPTEKEILLVRPILSKVGGKLGKWVSEWLLLIVNSAIFQLYHDENKLIFNEMRMRSVLFLMVSLLSSNAVDRGFKPRSDWTKDYKIGMCCFSAKHATLRRKSKDWLAQNQNNVSEWSNMM
jgi:hypothetical protein